MCYNLVLSGDMDMNEDILIKKINARLIEHYRINRTEKYVEVKTIDDSLPRKNDYSSVIHYLADYELKTNTDIEDGISNYTIDKEKDLVTIKYLDGNIEELSLEEATIKFLERNQKKSIDQRLAATRKRNFLHFFVYSCSYEIVYMILNLISQQNPSDVLLLGLPSAICVALVYSISGSAKDVDIFKIQKWLYENRDLVNEVIQKEDSLYFKPVEVDESGLIPVTISEEAITSRLPYPEEIYHDGLNLGNINLLDDFDLKDLKKKTKKLQKEKRKIKQL